MGDHGAGLCQPVLGAKDQRGSATNGGSHLSPRRVEGRGGGRVRVGETTTTAGVLGATRTPGAGIGCVLEERGERLSQSADAVERLNR